MNRKQTPANNIMRILGGVIFLAVLAINASGEPTLQRLMVPIIVVLVVGMSVARMVYGLFSRGADASASASGGARQLVMVMVVIGLIGFGAAVYFMLGTGGGGAPPAFRDLFNWAPLAGAFDALSQWGGLLIVGGLVAVVAAVVLIVVLRRGSEMPGGPSKPWNPDDPS